MLSREQINQLAALNPDALQKGITRLRSVGDVEGLKMIGKVLADHAAGLRRYAAARQAKAN